MVGSLIFVILLGWICQRVYLASIWKLARGRFQSDHQFSQPAHVGNRNPDLRTDATPKKPNPLRSPARRVISRRTLAGHLPIFLVVDTLGSQKLLGANAERK